MLLRRLKTAMGTLLPEDLTVEELRLLVAVVEAAHDRLSRPARNVVDFAARRRSIPLSR